MKNWTIGKRIGVGFATVVLITGCLGAFCLSRISHIQKLSGKVVNDCLPGTALSGGFDGWARQEFSLLQMLLLTEDPAAGRKLEEELGKYITRFDTDFKKYQGTITTAEDRTLFDKTRAAYEKWAALRERAFQLVKGGKRTEAKQTLASLYDVSSQLTELTGSMMDWNANNGAAVGKSIETTLAGSRAGVATGLSLACASALLIAWSIRRSVSRLLFNIAGTLNMGADQVAAASAQVAAASQTLADGASSQAASLEETSAALEEIASMIRRNSDASDQAKQIASETRTAADVGAMDMEQMKQSMADIKDSSDNVAKIVKTIDEIAFQTNILALNAAVEAARAGEAGAGFAIVADEVRSLAQRSALAARETSEKISDAISKSVLGVEVSTKVAASFGQITSKARQLDELVTQIAVASKEQSEGISQINLAVIQIDKVTQSSAATSEESAAASEELNAQAVGQKQSVAELISLVGGKPAASAHRNKPVRSEGNRTPNQKKEAAGSPGQRHGNKNARVCDEDRSALPMPPNPSTSHAPQDHKAVPEFKDF